MSEKYFMQKFEGEIANEEVRRLLKEKEELNEQRRKIDFEIAEIRGARDHTYFIEDIRDRGWESERIFICSKCGQNDWD